MHCIMIEDQYQCTPVCNLQFSLTFLVVSHEFVSFQNHFDGSSTKIRIGKEKGASFIFFHDSR
jgi:hypothetical protein